MSAAWPTTFVSAYSPGGIGTTIITVSGYSGDYEADTVQLYLSPAELRCVAIVLNTIADAAEIGPGSGAKHLEIRWPGEEKD
jgi:hypothetical protein